jgi:formylglycine-generating enzyme
VWEWTSDWYTPVPGKQSPSPCCAPDPQVADPTRGPALSSPGERFPRKVIKGGSHLCAPNYCLRYRPAARQAQMTETSASHLGFRCIVRE